MLKTNALHLNGIVPMVPTPFTIEEQIDWPSLRRLVDIACATGACAMCLPAYASAAVRPLTLQLDRHTEDRIAFLNERILALPDRVDLARHPSLLPSHEGVLEL